VVCAPHAGLRMAKTQIVGEFLQFLKQEKKYWLAPIVVVLVLFGLLLVFAQSSAVAPFIYSLF
jgi:drug/metabolite transporter superfamily protein YnfA